MHLLSVAEPRVVGTAAKAVFINNMRRVVPETNLDAAGTTPKRPKMTVVVTPSPDALRCVEPT